MRVADARYIGRNKTAAAFVTRDNWARVRFAIRKLGAEQTAQVDCKVPCSIVAVEPVEPSGTLVPVFFYIPSGIGMRERR